MFADRAAVVDAFDGWLARGCRAVGGRRSSPTSATRASRPSSTRLRRLAGPARRRRARRRGSAAAGGVRRAIAERYATAAGPRGRCSAGSSRRDPAGRRSRSTGSTRWPGRSTVRLATAGRHNAANALAVAGAAVALGVAPRAHRRAASQRSRASAAGWSARARPAASSSTTTTATTRRRSARRSRAVRQREPGRRDLGRLRAADLPPHGRDARRASPTCSPTADAVADRRHLGRPGPGHDGRLGRRPRRGRRARARPDIPVEAPGLASRRPPTGLPTQVRAGDAVLVMGGGRSYRIGELLLRATWRTDDDRLRAGGRPARGVQARAGRPSTATPGSALFTEDAEYHAGSVRAAAGRATTRSGHTCSRPPRREEHVEFTVERHWVVGRHGPRRWHASFIRRADAGDGPARGFMTLSSARTGASPLRGCGRSTREHRAGQEGGDRWRETSRSTSSATSTSRSCATRSTRSGARSSSATTSRARPST